MPRFSDVKRALSKAGDSLRQFTLGQKGVTQKAGLATIARMRVLCERINEGIKTGAYNRDAAYVVVTARGQILAAEARLALLRK